MKKQRKTLFAMLTFALILPLTFMMVACAGEDGEDGADGQRGVAITVAETAPTANLIEGDVWVRTSTGVWSIWSPLPAPAGTWTAIPQPPAPTPADPEPPLPLPVLVQAIVDAEIALEAYLDAAALVAPGSALVVAELGANATFTSVNNTDNRDAWRLAAAALHSAQLDVREAQIDLWYAIQPLGDLTVEVPVVDGAGEPVADTYAEVVISRAELLVNGFEAAMVADILSYVAPIGTLVTNVEGLVQDDEYLTATGAASAFDTVRANVIAILDEAVRFDNLSRVAVSLPAITAPHGSPGGDWPAVADRTRLVDIQDFVPAATVELLESAFALIETDVLESLNFSEGLSSATVVGSGDGERSLIDSDDIEINFETQVITITVESMAGTDSVRIENLGEFGTLGTANGNVRATVGTADGALVSTATGINILGNANAAARTVIIHQRAAEGNDWTVVAAFQLVFVLAE